jgi:opacity protein-like surface antigen
MKSLLLGGVAAFAVCSFAFAADAPSPVKMTDQQLDQVVAGWKNGEPCGISECGNNGWGNGTDGINPGSDNGGTAPSKLANGTAGPGINTNPTNSTGR